MDFGQVDEYEEQEEQHESNEFYFEDEDPDLPQTTPDRDRSDHASDDEPEDDFELAKSDIDVSESSVYQAPSESTRSDTHSKAEELEDLKLVGGHYARAVVPKQERSTAPWLSKYEKADIVGLRAKQIMKNSPLYIDRPVEPLTCLQLAELQLMSKSLPFSIWRVLSDGSCEEWSLEELELPLNQ